VLRASAACEVAGIPTSSLVCEGFIVQAKATTKGLGFPVLPVAMIPGHINVQSKEELRDNVLKVTTDHVVANLLALADHGSDAEPEPDPAEIVFAGSLTEVNAHYVKMRWSDGLPIVPPTRDNVDAFLRHTSRGADEVLGVMLPDNRAATVRGVAINGVMAGCRPEYMPVLVALVEAMADPKYGVEHSGNTPGSETLIIVNGAIAKQLEMNVEQGVMRDGFQANTSIGRFWRLCLRNLVGFMPHETDKACYGNTWRVAIGENEQALAELGWPNMATELGEPPGVNAVTIARYTGGNVLPSVCGATPPEMLPYIADAIVRQTSWHLTFLMAGGYGSYRPLVMITPILARTIAKAGWSKTDIRKFLFEHARMPAWQFERLLRDWNTRPSWNLTKEVAEGNIPKIFAESDDPERLVPVVWEADHILIAVTGDPMRTNAYVFAGNGQLGFPTTRRIS